MTITNPPVQYVSLNRLIASKNNAQRKYCKADLGALAASIQAGLLQNLVVVPSAKGRFQVVVGGRRHAALKALARSGAIPRDFAVPCNVIDADRASKLSVAEDVQAVAMNAMDEVEVLPELAGAGRSGGDIAERFGCTGRMKVSDRLARFVGLGRYEEAGGKLTRDLFEGEADFVNDPALMTRLADELLESMRADLLAAGWGWVTVNLGEQHLGGVASPRLYPTRRAMTEDERKAVEEVDALLAALDEALENAEQGDPRWDERDLLSACRHSVVEGTIVWDRELIAHAGVVINIDPEGRPSLSFGLVINADQSTI